jgi:hypothetical protein
VKTRRLACCLALGLFIGAPAARAELSSALLPELFAFPGAVTGPPSAVSAGLGLADLWLGDEPFGNPAAFPARAVVLAPAFLRVSRQDLRAHTSAYDETRGFLDAAGARLSWPVRSVGLSLYAWQPVLRREDQAYTGVLRGVPGTFKTSSTAREARVGLAVSAPWRTVRFGLAGEWTQRDDSYEYSEQSANPYRGSHHVDFSGGALGFRSGVRFAPHPRVEVGAALGYLPALDLAGESRYVPRETIPGDTSSVTVRRASAWEGGVAVQIGVTRGFRVLASVGGRTAQDWNARSVGMRTKIELKSPFAPGPVAAWSIGLDFHDAQDPWWARIGVGQEQQRDVPEPRSGLVSLGLGWDLEGVKLDVAALRRSIARPGKATSYDDRIVASATVTF